MIRRLLLMLAVPNNRYSNLLKKFLRTYLQEGQIVLLPAILSLVQKTADQARHSQIYTKTVESYLHQRIKQTVQQ